MGQAAKLNRVLVIIDAGMPCSALAAAEAMHVQFSPTALNRWHRGPWGPRWTYTWLVRERRS